MLSRRFRHEDMEPCYALIPQKEGNEVAEVLEIASTQTTISEIDYCDG